MVYNILNAILYCILAGAMISVSASAVGLGFGIKHPRLDDVLPNSMGWVLVVLLVGAVVVSLAILGFKKLSQFSAVCAPWMFLVFIAGAIATLPKLGEFRSLAELWTLADTRIWNGVPTEGVEKLGFWHVTFFAWFCNLAMHVGLSDMALFRYARHWTYGFYSALGMYLGHFLAWICAGVMGAMVAGLNPGQMANMAVGFAGVMAVVIAGWTTANPTLYRAGLALQIATPNWPRWKITLVAGAITTIVACFPIFFMKLLDFVAIYGLVLMPIGAIVFAEHWLFPRLGLRQYWAQAKGVTFNIPALITWAATLLLCYGMGHPSVDLHLFFRWLPGWFIAVALYTLLCSLYVDVRKKAEEPAITATEPSEALQSPTTKPQVEHGLLFWISGAIALLSLLALILFPLQVFFGGSVPDVYEANLASYKQSFLIATAIYFVSAIICATQREKAKATG